MPCKLRIQYPGAMYYVMNRGDRRERIFLDDIERQDLIKTLAEACHKTEKRAARPRTMHRKQDWASEPMDTNGQQRSKLWADPFPDNCGSGP